jgi:hypothetical protein
MRKMALSLLVVLGMSATAQAATSWYVSPSGHDGPGCGSESSPCQTISYTAKQTQAGDTVYIQGGHTYQEQVTIRNSGVLGAPITYTTYGSGSVTLDGNNGTIDYGIYAPKTSYVTIENLVVQNYKYAGIHFEGPDDHIVIQNNYVIGNGVQAPRDSLGDGITLEGYWPNQPLTNVTVYNNTVVHNSPLSISSGSGIDMFFVNGATVTYNTCDYNNGNGILAEDSWGTPSDPLLLQHNRVRYNVVDEGTWGTGGFWLSGGHDVTVTNNWIEGNVWDGIEFTNEQAGFGTLGIPHGYRIYNNVLLNNWWGISLQGLDGSDDTNYIFNNTVIDSNFAGIYLANEGRPRTIGYTELFNNLSQQSNFNRPALLVDGGLSFPSFTSDYNLYDTTGSSQTISWAGTFESFDQYQETTGWDAHSISAVPSFQNPSNADYHLLTGSAGSAAGTVDASFYPPRFDVSAWTDFDGHPRPDTAGTNVDMGGLETPGPCLTDIFGDACSTGEPASFAYDSAINPHEPVKVTLLKGEDSKSVNVSAVVKNTDAIGSFPHRIQLVANDGTCPAGTVAGLPNFPGTYLSGARDTLYLHPNITGAGEVPLVINRSSFQGVATCALQFSAQSPIPGNVDPTPDDNATSVTLEIKLE